MSAHRVEISKVKANQWFDVLHRFKQEVDEVDEKLADCSDNDKAKFNAVKEFSEKLYQASCDTLAHFLTQHCGDVGSGINSQILHLKDEDGTEFPKWFQDGETGDDYGLYGSVTSSETYDSISVRWFLLAKVGERPAITEKYTIVIED
tara:strand:- start:254 stop:697 length:444 start_codon:yes stop_codon:yes gene_type:complete